MRTQLYGVDLYRPRKEWRKFCSPVLPWVSAMVAAPKRRLGCRLLVRRPSEMALARQCYRLQSFDSMGHFTSGYIRMATKTIRCSSIGSSGSAFNLTFHRRDWLKMEHMIG